MKITMTKEVAPLELLPGQTILTDKGGTLVVSQVVRSVDGLTINGRPTGREHGRHEIHRVAEGATVQRLPEQAEEEDLMRAWSQGPLTWDLGDSREGVLLRSAIGGWVITVTGSHRLGPIVPKLVRGPSSALGEVNPETAS